MLKINWRPKNKKFAALISQVKTASVPRTATAMLYIPRGWPENEAPLIWAVRDAAGRVQQGSCAQLADFPAPLRTLRLQVWTAGAETLLTSANLPTRTRAKILQALPYALEEQILGEPEGMSYAYRALGDGKLAVAVTAKDRIDAWRAALTEAGLRPATVAPITVGIPYSEPDWSAAFLDGGLVVRTGSDAGFDTVLGGDAPPALLTAALREARAQERAPARLRVFNAPRDWRADLWSQGLALPVDVESAPLWQVLETPGISLLQAGAHSSSGQWQHPVLAKLKPAGILFSIWLIAGFVFSAWEWAQLSRTAKAQREEMTALFRRTFPEAKTVVDPALQMQRSLTELQGRGAASNPTDFLPMLQVVAPTLRDHPAVQLQGIQYAETGATLDVHAPDFQALEAVTQALTARGLKADIAGSNSRGNAVDAKLRIGRGKAA